MKKFVKKSLSATTSSNWEAMPALSFSDLNMITNKPSELYMPVQTMTEVCPISLQLANSSDLWNHHTTAAAAHSDFLTDKMHGK